MTERPGDLTSRDMPPQFPLVDGPTARTRAHHRKILLADSHSNAFRIGVEMFTDKVDLTERGSHQDVGLAATANEISRDLRT